MKFYKKALFYLLAFILASLILAPILRGNISFNTDIARDFLLLEDVYYNKNITLIGPRTGGIPGLFHGPLWLYLNLPAYIIGAGNPIAVGYFWFLLLVFGAVIVYFVSKKIFDKNVAVISSLIYFSVLGKSVTGFFNPVGAVLLFPLFFYFFWLYFKEKKNLYLAASMLILGCLIQFQMAFGGPIFILSAILIFIFAFKKRRFFDPLIILVIIIPLSSYILFELRHNFIEVKSLIGYLNGTENTGKVDINFMDLLFERLNFLFSDTLGMISHNVTWLTILSSFVIIKSNLKKIKLKFKNPFFLFTYLLFGYWFLTIFYKGAIWGYYYWPFVGLVAIFFAAGYKYVNKKFFALIVVLILLNNIRPLYWQAKAYPQAQGSWRFFRQSAEQAFDMASEKEFGYYVYTTDQFGYSTRYAVHYLNRKKNNLAAADEKKPITILFIDDPGDSGSSNSVDWKKYDVKISGAPDELIEISDSYKLEKYNLNEEEIQVKSNPDMLNSIIFR